MSRGFLGGIVWGGVFAGLGLAVASQFTAPVTPEALGAAGQAPSKPVAVEVSTPPALASDAEKPGEDVALDTPAAMPETAAAPSGDAAPEAPPSEPPVAAVAPEPAPPEGPAPVVTADAPSQADPAGAAASAPQAPVVAASNPTPSATPDAPAAVSVLPQAEIDRSPAPRPAVTETSAGLRQPASPPSPPVLEGGTGPASEATLPSAAAQPEAATPEAEPDRAELPPPPPLSAEEQAVVDANTAPPQPDPPGQDTQASAEPEPQRPTPGFANRVEGVTTGRLPSITSGPVVDPAPGDAPPDVVVVVDDLPPVDRFAQSFSNPMGKPVFSVLLLDDGAAGTDRAALAALPFPVSFVLDPTNPNSAEIAVLYQAAGKEVVMLAAGIPEGATPADLAVSFEANAQVLPQAVAVIDSFTGIYQNNRQLAADVLAEIGAQGRGVLSWDRGLNAASQIARREGLRNALVYRHLDADGEAGTVIRRYLDRAAFKAAQDGRVIVLGTTRPETVAALLEWAVEGRAATVALAPVTATLTAQ